MTCTFHCVLFQLLRERSPLPKTPYPASLLGSPVFCFAYTIDWSRIKWADAAFVFQLRGLVSVLVCEKKKGLKLTLSPCCAPGYVCWCVSKIKKERHSRVGRCFLELLIYLLCFPQNSDRRTQLTLTTTFFLIQTPSPFSFTT